MCLDVIDETVNLIKDDENEGLNFSLDDEVVRFSF